MGSRFANRTIAIVDDDPDILQSIEMAFRHEGARTLTATDGLGALHLVREHAGAGGDAPGLQRLAAAPIEHPQARPWRQDRQDVVGDAGVVDAAVARSSTYSCST